MTPSNTLLGPGLALCLSRKTVAMSYRLMMMMIILIIVMTIVIIIIIMHIIRCRERRGG